jgi:hypothetical protein
MSLTLEQTQQVHHIAALAVLAMAARAAASVEFAATPEAGRVVFAVSRTDSGEHDLDVEIQTNSGALIGGYSA